MEVSGSFENGEHRLEMLAQECTWRAVPYICPGEDSMDSKQMTQLRNPPSP